MQKCKAKWIAFLTATLLLLTFALGACGGEDANPDWRLGELRAIYISQSDLKTTYTVGEEFDYSAVKITAVYANGDKQLTGTSEGVTHNDLDMATAGTQTLTFTYEGKSASVGITIREEEKAVLKGLQFSGGKTAYQVGEEIDYSQFRLTAIYSVGNDVALTGASEGVTHNTVSTDEAGTKQITFTYSEGGVEKTVTVDIIVSAAPVPTTLISIEVKSTAADRSVAFGATLDETFLAKFTIVRYYSDGTSDSTLKGNSEGVTNNLDEIYTSVEGDHDLTFTVEGKTATVPITVLPQVQKQTLNRFALPKFYTDVAAVRDDANGTQSTDRDIFMKGFETYKVGDDNAFEFQPDATVLASLTHEVSVIVSTTFTLEEKGEDGNFTAVPAEQLENYVKTDPLLPNYYWFQPNAVGKVFKLKVQADADHYTVTGGNKTLEAIIEVVDGYNVYNQIGLSVFDNLNVKHWHDVKTAAGTLRWDSKPLIDYNIIKTGDDKFAPVANIVLHSNITIDPDELPESYFWKTTDDQYNTVETILQGNSEIPDSVKNYLEGSLKDGLNDQQWYRFDNETSGELNEDAKSGVNMQKGLYVSTGTGIAGNFHEITYHTSGTKHNLYTVYDGKSETGTAFPLSHWSLFKYGNETTAGVEIVNGGEPTVSDLRILGQSPRLAATNGEPAHLMAFNSCTNTMTLKNSIISRLFVAVLGDEASSGVKVSDSKIFDIYSNMFYLWRASMNIKNCIMEDAGGPIFILCDGNRGANDNSGHGTITVDAASRLRSDAGGEESWYKLNNATPIFTQLKSVVLNYIHEGTHREIMHQGERGSELFNIIAIIVPEPANLQGNSELTIFPKGEIKRGEEGNYTDEYAVDWKFAEGGLLSMVGQTPDSFYRTIAPIFISGTEKITYVGNSMFPYLGASTENLAGAASNADFAARGTDWMFATMRAGANDPRFGILFGDVTAYSA